MEHGIAKRVLVVPLLAALLTAAAGVGGALLARGREQDRQRNGFTAAVVPAITDLDTELDLIARTGEGIETSVEVSGGDPDPAGAAITAIALRGIRLNEDGARRALRVTLEPTRDTGTLHTSPAVRSDVGGVLLFVTPAYRPDAPTATTSERRAALERWLIGVLRPAGAAEVVFGPLLADGASVHLRAGEVSLFRGGTTSGEAPVRARIAVGGRSLTVEARPPASGGGLLPPTVLLTGLALSLLLLATGRHAQRVERRAARAAAARQDDLHAIAGIGPLLQESLDLAEVLPAAAAFMADQFRLDGVSIAHTDDDGDLVEAFTVGRRLVGIPRRVAELRSPPDVVEAGDVVAVPLLRAGRVIGALHALARTALSQERTRTLVTVAEMIGTALANARQFEREQEMVRRLTELDRLKTEFLGTVSHELQTPITAILGFSSMLDEQFDTLTPEDRRDFVARVARNATSLSSLVRELLDYSRIGRQRFELHVQELDLSELTKRIVDQFASLVDRHEIIVDAPPQLFAAADTEALERVLANLLSNAAKYSPPGTAITVTLSAAGDEARVVVDDAGPGVSAEDRPHVFHRFYRGSSPAAVATRGAGIGLAVVKDLVERMGGTVAVGSAPSGGARFTVTLPVRRTAIPSSELRGQGRMS